MKVQIMTVMLILLALGCSEADQVSPDARQEPEASGLQIAVPQFCNDMSEYTQYLEVVNGVPAFTDEFVEHGEKRWRDVVLQTYTRQNEADTFESEMLAPLQQELERCTTDCEAQEQNVVRLQGVLQEIRRDVAAEMERFDIGYAPVCEPLSAQECAVFSTDVYKTSSPLDCTTEQFVCKEIKRVADKDTGNTLVTSEYFRDTDQEFLLIVDENAVTNTVCSQTF